MMNVQHKQTGETREVSRHEWENPQSEYQTINHVWAVLDEGDPVTVIWIEDDRSERELGLFDRDHALRMVKQDTKRCYIKEIDRIPGLISKVLLDVGENRLSLMRGSVDDYQRAVMKAMELGLLKEYTENSFGVTNKGRKAIELGGYEKWKVYNENTELQGHAIKRHDSALIDQALNDAQECYISLMRDTPPDYQKAVEKAKRHGLLKAVSKTSYELTDEGYRALDLGGFNRWQEYKANREAQRDGLVNIYGDNAIVGNNNSGNLQGSTLRDLNSQSPTFTTNQQPTEIPKSNPIKKSDHSMWDKIKYTSQIIAGLAGLAGAIVAVTKLLGWW